MKAKWPKEVPILTAQDICKGRLGDNAGRHCLIGWRRETFGAWEENSASSLVDSAIYLEIGDRVGGRVADSIANFNDAKSRPKWKIARVWNRAMAKLGYVVGNPEAKA